VIYSRHQLRGGIGGKEAERGGVLRICQGGRNNADCVWGAAGDIWTMYGVAPSALGPPAALTRYAAPTAT